MTRLRPAGAGPGHRALLAATALGAVLVTGLALAFAALAAAPPARAPTSVRHVARAAAVPAAEAWLSTVAAFGARAGQLVEHTASNGGHHTSAPAASAPGTFGTAGGGDALRRHAR